MLLWVLLVFLALTGVGCWSTRRVFRKLSLRRPSPTEKEFFELMEPDVARETAQWLWDQICIYTRPLTPHPDDLLIDDLRIDEDDVTMDWHSDFAKIHGLIDDAWPDWPREWPITVRNYGRWLDCGLA